MAAQILAQHAASQREMDQFFDPRNEDADVDYEESEGLRLVSIKDTIRMLGCGRTALYKYLNEGTIEAVHVGRKTMIPLSEIERFVEQLPRFRPRLPKANT